MPDRSFPSSTLIRLLLVVMLSGCSSTYYNAMEKIGIHKRDIMVDRVEHARDSQQHAQQQFKSALEQFQSVIGMEDTDLKQAYERLDREYQDCLAVAGDVSSRIDKVEAVAEDLFDEWREEISLYQNRELARSSQKQLTATKIRYAEMIKHMKEAEQRMPPVLAIFRDNVLFLKHNLNAQAIGSLQQEFATLRSEIEILIDKMNGAIVSSNVFIDNMQSS